MRISFVSIPMIISVLIPGGSNKITFTEHGSEYIPKSSLPDADSTVVIDFDPIGPYDEYAKNEELVGHLTSRKVHLDAYEKLSVGPIDGDYKYIDETSPHTVAPNTVYDFTLILPIRGWLSSSGMRCTVQALQTNGTVLATYHFNLKPSSHNHIYPSQYIDKNYLCDSVTVDPDSFSSKRYELYRFINYVDYFDEDYYYRLRINHLSILYSCFNSFPGCNASLHFVDYNHIFPFLDSDDEIPEVDIPLRYEVKNSQITFNFPQNMYVNPQTMDMSLNAKSDFVLTNHFYLPKNKKDLLLDQVFELRVDNFGYDKVSFTWQLSYLNNHNLIGDCSDSDYCVVGDMY